MDLLTILSALNGFHILVTGENDWKGLNLFVLTGKKKCRGETITLQSCSSNLGLVADIADDSSSLFAVHGMEQAISKTRYRIIG